MFDFLHSINIRTKLIAAFVLISSILLIVGLREYIILRQLNHNQTKIVRNFSVSQNLIKVKFNVGLEVQNLMELRLSDNIEKVEVHWQKHKRLLLITKKQLQLISDSTAYGSIKSKTTILPLIDTVMSFYSKDINANYQKIYNAKSELIKIEDSQLDFSDFEIAKFIDVENDPFVNELVDDTIQNDLQQTDYEKKFILKTEISEFSSALDSVYTLISQKLEFADKTVTGIVLETQNASIDVINISSKIIIVIVLFSLILSIIIATVISNIILQPITILKTLINKLSKGLLPNEVEVIGHDEIAEITIAVNHLVNSLQKVSDFSVEIGKGNYTSRFKPLSNEDVLGNSLIDMRENLKKAAVETQNRKKEDNIRNWNTAGYSNVSEILQKNKSIEGISDDLIKYIVKYIGANIGGIFTYDSGDNNSQLELKALCAYDRKRIVERKIQKGEGLLWACVLEKETIYSTDIPEEYVEIKSGLGNASPKSLLIVPLKTEDKIQGIIEIASLGEIKDYQIQFVEKVAENIAISFANKIMSTRTSDLLKQSQIQTEKLHAQENVMRQSLNEMHEVKTESEKREAISKERVQKLEKLLRSLDIDVSDE